MCAFLATAVAVVAALGATVVAKEKKKKIFKQHFVFVHLQKKGHFCSIVTGKKKKMKDCSETPTMNTRSFNDCLAVLEDNFSFIGTLGRGKGGIVIALQKNMGSRSFAVKISPLAEDSAKEVEIACKLNKLFNKTQIFPLTYGWIVCGRIPESWIKHRRNAFRAIMEQWEGQKLLFMFQSAIPLKFYDEEVPKTPDAMRAAIYLLLHGIGEARKEFNGFRHRDIHTGNIMWGLLPGAIGGEGGGAKTETIPVVGQNVRVRATHMPKLIDYGFAEFGMPVEDEVDAMWNYSFTDGSRRADFGIPDNDEDAGFFETAEELQLYEEAGFNIFAPQNDLTRIRNIFFREVAVDNEYAQEDMKEFFEFFNSDVYKNTEKGPTNTLWNNGAVLQHPFFNKVLIKPPPGPKYVPGISDRTRKTPTKPTDIDAGVIYCVSCGIRESVCCFDTNPDFSFCKDQICQDFFSGGMDLLLPQKN